MANIINIINTIRANGSNEYQGRIPEATRDTFTSVGNAILEYSTTKNEFLNALVNRIALVVVRNKIAQNPLSVLKKGSVPYGKDIEEIFTNMANSSEYDMDGAGLLATQKPDTKAIYHRRNRKDKYKVTIWDDQLREAFVTPEKMGELITSIINSLYSGDNYDEFILCKNLFADAISTNKVVTIACDALTDESTAKAFVKSVKTTSGLFQFPSSTFNKYYDNKPDSDTGGAIVTWTPKENQILIIRSDILSTLDVDVLAAAFNMDKVSFMGRVLEVDNFGSASNCVAILADEAFTQVYDNNFKTTNFYNSEGLYTNFWLHHWQTYSFSYFCNCVAFLEPLSYTDGTAAVKVVGDTTVTIKDGATVVKSFTSGGTVALTPLKSYTLAGDYTSVSIKDGDGDAVVITESAFTMPATGFIIITAEE